VLLSANPGDHRDYDAVAPELSKSYRTIAVDWPGYGESAPPEPPSSASAMMFADLLAELVEALALGPAAFIGNSVGCFAAARLAIEQPHRVRALVLVDPSGFTSHTPESEDFCRNKKGSEAVTAAIAGDFARGYLKLRNSGVDEIIARADEERGIPSRVAVDAAVWRSFPEPAHDLRERAAAIGCPTLLVWGAR
jgi:pimeloyl-ACP methyl ester carboxylesterase